MLKPSAEGVVKLGRTDNGQGDCGRGGNSGDGLKAVGGWDRRTGGIGPGLPFPARSL